jgi:hypothetical protein
MTKSELLLTQVINKEFPIKSIDWQNKLFAKLMNGTDTSKSFTVDVIILFLNGKPKKILRINPFLLKD